MHFYIHCTVCDMLLYTSHTILLYHTVLCTVLHILCVIICWYAHVPCIVRCQFTNCVTYIASVSIVVLITYYSIVLVSILCIVHVFHFVHSTRVPDL